MDYWIYILKGNNDKYYIGETNNIFKCISTYIDSAGFIDESTLVNPQLVGLFDANIIHQFRIYRTYSVYDDYDFGDKCIVSLLNNFDDIASRVSLEYFDVLVATTFITEWMVHIVGADMVRGEEYNQTRLYTYPINPLSMNLPKCNCNLPCDIKRNPAGYLYFRCSKKNMYNDLINKFGITSKPCSFFKRCDDVDYLLRRKLLMDKISTLAQSSPWLYNLPGDFSGCVGECEIQGTSYKMIHVKNHVYPVCYRCFIAKQNELARKFALKQSDTPLMKKISPEKSEHDINMVDDSIQHTACVIKPKITIKPTTGVINDTLSARTKEGEQTVTIFGFQRRATIYGTPCPDHFHHKL